jgi:HAD superfamily hydrolase (TIGR01509 family)
MMRGIIFDCFGVLVRGSLAHLRSLAPPENLTALNDLSRQSDYGYVSQADYLQGVGQLLGRSSKEIAAIIMAQYVRNDQMIALVLRLRTEHKIALLSNVGRNVIRQLFTARELDELFDAVILSSEVGMIKPHADIYELTARRLDLTPEECIMVDDLLENVEGAKAAGMSGVLCVDAAQCEADLIKLLRGSHARVA